MAAIKLHLLVKDYKSITCRGKALGANGEYIPLGCPVVKKPLAPAAPQVFGDTLTDHHTLLAFPQNLTMKNSGKVTLFLLVKSYVEVS